MSSRVASERVSNLGVGCVKTSQANNSAESSSDLHLHIDGTESGSGLGWKAY